ncbi:MAG: holo-[acyl-carrier-protein] synthase [Synergistales bacterium]|nr:holo-[acyl-carrier-protein] synthase [Synergistales bacterium]
MILGVGVDICRISRMSRFTREDHFVRRVFSPEEICYSYSKPCPARHLASSFAAKEAFSKASGFPLFRVISGGISVSRSETGPRLSFVGVDEELKLGFSKFNFHLSLSHDGDYSVAFVVMEDRQ